MSDKKKKKDDPFKNAFGDCLGDCFKVLASRIASGDETAEDSFKKCCEDCRKAREIAKKVVVLKS